METIVGVNAEVCPTTDIPGNSQSAPPVVVRFDCAGELRSEQKGTKFLLDPPKTWTNHAL